MLSTRSSWLLRGVFPAAKSLIAVLVLSPVPSCWLGDSALGPDARVAQLTLVLVPTLSTQGLSSPSAVGPLVGVGSLGFIVRRTDGSLVVADTVPVDIESRRVEYAIEVTYTPPAETFTVEVVLLDSNGDELFTGGPIEYTVSESEPSPLEMLVVYVGATGTVSGLVSVGGTGLDGVTVSLVGELSLSTTTAGGGAYTFLNVWAPGDYTLAISGFGAFVFAEMSRSVSLGVAQTAVVDFVGAVASEVIYDLQADWSDVANPNGVWALKGGTTLLTAVPDLSTTGLDTWTPAQPGFTGAPAFGITPAWYKAAAQLDGNDPDFQNGDIVTHTSRPGAPLSNVTWTSDLDGVIDIAGNVWAARTLARRNDWFLYLNTQLLTSGTIDDPDPYDRANPLSLDAGSGGATPLQAISVSVGDVVKLEFGQEPGFDEDYVGVNLTITGTGVVRPPGGVICSESPASAIATFDDANLEAAVRAALGIGALEDLTCGLLSGLTDLNAIGASIMSLVGIQNLTGLATLDLGSNSITDISPLSGLTSLTRLSVFGLDGLTGNVISDISALSGLTNLTSLNLDNTGSITDLSPLSGLTGLTSLQIRGNSIADIGPLSGLTNLTGLNLAANVITDVSPLSELTALTFLALNDNENITDISPLSGLINLTISFWINGNSITDISALSGMTMLRRLIASRNSIVDITALETLTSLNSVNLSSNLDLADVQPLIDNTGLGAGDQVFLTSTSVSCADVAALEANGVTVGSDCPAGVIFLSVNAGGLHSCGLTPEGTAQCWGYNLNGQLGDGTNTNSNVPVTVSGGLTFQSVRAGRTQSCGVTTAGVAYCWGFNGDGQLGNGTTTDSNVPVAVSGGLTFQSVSPGLGIGHSCGLTTAGAAHCWGANIDGRLGDGTNTNSLVPVAVSGGLTFQSVSVGQRFSCALTTGQVAYCWGFNSGGPLGDGTFTERNVPVAVLTGLTFQQLSAGTSHSCAVTTAGNGFCWGFNGNGELGDTTTTTRLVPGAVAPALTFQSVTAGGSQSCGVTLVGDGYCWGWNSNGQLGDGTTTNSLVPVPISGGLTFQSAGPHENHSCGLTTAGAAYCWGVNLYGQLGDGTTANRLVPTRVGG